MNLTNLVKHDILAELKNGNTEVLKGLPPVVAMQYGLALQNEVGVLQEESQLNDEAVNESMLNLLKDSGVKERLIKEIEKERAERNK